MCSALICTKYFKHFHFALLRKLTDWYIGFNIIFWPRKAIYNNLQTISIHVHHWKSWLQHSLDGSRTKLNPNIETETLSLAQTHQYWNLPILLTRWANIWFISNIATPRANPCSGSFQACQNLIERYLYQTPFRVSSHEPSQNSLTFPWHFPDHFVVFPDHETYYRHFITALTLILQAIWQITHQK